MKKGRVCLPFGDSPCILSIILRSCRVYIIIIIIVVVHYNNIMYNSTRFFFAAHTHSDEQYSIIYYYGRRRIPAVPIIYGIYIYTYAQRLRRYLYRATLSLSAVTAVLANMVVFFTLFLNLYGHTVV